MITVIMAGGKGTRISSIASDIPKPMIDLHGKPILERQMECLMKQGINEVVLVIGHLGDKIVEYFGDGSALGMKIRYIKEESPLGTAGGLYYLKDHDNGRNIDEPILLLNGDIVFDIDIDRFHNFHKTKNADITLFTHPNNHPHDSALIVTDRDSRIIKWLNKEDPRDDYRNRVNAGIHILDTKVLSEIWKAEVPVKLDLDRDIIKEGISSRSLGVYAYDSPEYVKDMGTPERYAQVCSDFRNGMVESKNLLRKQKAVFLDRDGTLNIHPGGLFFITRKEDLNLVEGAAEAVSRINNSGYLAIVVTNQPVIARGECTLEELEQIHNRIERLLGEAGAYLDDIIFCPHHPDKGFEGERPEYKIECECRKPKPGMLREMAEKYNIDLAGSFMIGDDQRDMQAGKAAGCRTCYISSDCSKISSGLYDYCSGDLKDVVAWLIGERK